MLHLEIVSPPGGRRIALRPGANVIGRAADAEILLDYPSLSRRHAELFVEGDEVRVRDLGSRHGTLLNGAPVGAPTRASHGDRLQCGDVLLVLRVVTPEVRPGSVVDPTSDPSRTVDLQHAARAAGDPVTRRLAILLRVGDLLARPGGSRALQERILELASEILPLDRAVLLKVDEAGRLEVVAARGSASPGERPYSESVVRYVLDKRLGALFTDAQADRRLDGAVSLVAQSIRCSMCAPLLFEDQLLGALYVDNRLTTHCFTPTDLDLLTGFANQAALALHTTALQEKVRQAAVRQSTFERFFPPATAARLVESGGDLGVSELDVSALFSDISGYTAMSSTMSPSEVVALLHAYFPPMARVVFDRDGTLEKYIGDALMAVWGAPFPHDDDADRALEAAVEMQRLVVELSPKLPRPIAIHVGIHSGVVALANIGSTEYLQVATIGDATNTAARVCSVAGDGEIVITRETVDRLRRPGRYPLTPLPPTRVKGKDAPLELFRVDWR